MEMNRIRGQGGRWWRERVRQWRPGTGGGRCDHGRDQEEDRR